MTTPSSKNILIVGGGLAGTFLATECLCAGHQVTLMDQPVADSASRIAAGLYNVITGRKAGRTWLAEELLDTLNAFFDRPLLEPLRKHFLSFPIYRVFKSPGEFNDWSVHSQDAAYNNWVRHQPTPRLPDLLHNPLGGLEILPCGWLQTGPFIDEMKILLQQKMGLKVLKGRLEHANLDPSQGRLNHAGHTYVYDDVVFAEGVGICTNPWFDWVTVWPLKGQVMEIEVPGLDLDFVLMRKLFFLPKGNNFYTVGATYEREFTETGPTEAGIAELSELVKAAIKLPFRVVNARAGLRPTTPNRRPVLGTHPEFSRLHVLNGLGTKGVLQGPWAAQMLRRWLDGELADLPKQLDVKRFLKKNRKF